MRNLNAAWNPVDGVDMVNAIVFVIADAYEECSTHIYGTPVGQGYAWQVCSPVQTIEEKDGYFTCVTRSGNKYVIDTDDFLPHPDKANLEVFLLAQGWLLGAYVSRLLTPSTMKDAFLPTTH